MTPWLSIVGLGEGGLAGLSPVARELIERAEVLVGGERHLAMVPEDGRERLTWTSPLLLLVDQIMERRGQKICVLATGDPMAFGIGVTFAKRLPREEMTIVPGVSAFSLAAARLGWNLAEADQLTLHGRPLELLHGYVQPNARLLILSEDGGTPARVADLLCERGYHESVMTVLEHMGGPKEEIVEATAAAWQGRWTADLNTLAVACVAGRTCAPGGRWLRPGPLRSSCRRPRRRMSSSRLP